MKLNELALTEMTNGRIPGSRQNTKRHLLFYSKYKRTFFSKFSAEGTFIFAAAVPDSMN